jgi:hypothetical protein
LRTKDHMEKDLERKLREIDKLKEELVERI